MIKKTQWLKVLLLVAIALLSVQNQALAGQVDNSVKDCLENPEKCSENQPLKKQGQEQQTEDTKIGITFWDVFRMLLATIFVVALLYFMLKFINKKGSGFRRTQVVENIGGTNLGGNRSVQIIKVGKRLMIVGVGESIHLLKEIDDPEEYRQIISDYNDKMEQLLQPSDIVTKVLQRAKKQTQDDKKESEFQSILKRQLEDIRLGRKRMFAEMDKKGRTDDE